MAYVLQLLGYDSSSVQSAAYSYVYNAAIVNTNYANPYFSSNTATTISYTSYTDSALTVNSPSGYYSDGAISRYYDNVNKTLSVATLCEYSSYVSGCCTQELYKLDSNSLIVVGSILNLNPSNFCYVAVPTPTPQTYYTPLNDYLGFNVLSPNYGCPGKNCQPCPTDCFGTCDVFYISADKVWGYNYASNISTNLTLNFNPPLTTTSVNIISTTDKIWLTDGNDLYEYDFTGCSITGFYAVFNRTISFAYQIGQSITAAIDDVTLLGSDSTGVDIYEIDISGVSPNNTFRFATPTNRVVIDMIYTNSAPNKLICLFSDPLSFTNYITQYDYITGAIEFDITLSNLGNNPIGIFTTSGNLYIIDVGGAVYNLQLYPPYNVTYVKNAAFGKIRSVSQSDICNNVVINPPTPPPPPPPPIPIPGVTVNNCTPITILPLGIECVTLAAPTQNYLFGSLSVNVTGGTSPYGIFWKDSNGVTSYGNNIINAPLGNYVVTVVDYWGDLSATTTCSLTYAFDCTFSGSVVDNAPPSQNFSYYNVQITGGTSLGLYSIYYNVVGNANYATNLTTGLPASGITLTQLNNNVGINVEVPNTLTKIILYNELCDTYQEFPVTPNIPINDCLCISIQETITNTYNQIEVCYTGDTLHGKPFYTNGVESVSWFYNGYWELNGYVTPGTIIRSGDSDNVPDTSWYAVGLNASSYTITATNGVCVASPPVPLFSKAYGENISCNTAFGNIVAEAIWGTPPWTYSLDGIIYSNTTGIFTNVGVGLYTVYAKDSLGVVLSTPVTVPSYTQPPITVTSTATQFTQISSFGNMEYYEVYFSFDTTTLPIGLTFNADYILNYNLKYFQPGSVTFDTTIHTLSINGVYQIINNTSSNPLNPVGSSSCNPLYSIYGGTEQYSSPSISIENSDIVFGNIIVGIDINTAGTFSFPIPCITSAQVVIQASLNVTYPTNPNCYSINTQQINQTVTSTFNGS